MAPVTAEPLLAAGPTIVIHTLAALGALVLGAALYALPKGRRPHQAIGITCAILLLTTALTAVFITTDPSGAFSWIHGFIPLTLFGLFGIWMGVARRNFRQHKFAARGIIFGALLVPGLFTFVPGRIMHAVVFGE